MRAARTLAHVLNQGVPVNYLLIKSLLSFQNTAQLPHRERASAHKAPTFLRGVAVKFKFVWTLTLVVGLGFSNLAAPAGKDDKPVTETAVAAAKNLAVVWPMAATYNAGAGAEAAGAPPCPVCLAGCRAGVGPLQHVDGIESGRARSQRGRGAVCV
jgi:hypothetical protein